MGDYYINMLLKKEKTKTPTFQKALTLEDKGNQIKKQGSYVCEAGVLMTKTCLNSGCYLTSLHILLCNFL